MQIAFTFVCRLQAADVGMLFEYLLRIEPNGNE
jgi:hypothetical protein